jgi:hypothetical protein
VLKRWTSKPPIWTRTPPAIDRGCFVVVPVLVSVTVMVAVVFFLGRLVDHRGRGGEELQPSALSSSHFATLGGAYSSAEEVNRVRRSLSCSASPGPITDTRRSASGSAAT